MSNGEAPSPTAGGLYSSGISGCTQPVIGKFSPADRLVRLAPFKYSYVLNTSFNTTRIIIGPERYTLQDGEELVLEPTDMLVVPPQFFVLIANPVMRDTKGAILLDAHEQAKLRHGDFEVRLHGEPFPLYPGEAVIGGITPLRIVLDGQALRLRAIRDFDGRKAGDTWLFEGGPKTYIPRPEVEVVELIKAVILGPDSGLVLKARLDFKDRFGTNRKAGETWLLRGVVGAYMPSVEEEVIRQTDAIVLTPRIALHLRATTSFIDVYGKPRHAGEEWLVTRAEAELHVPDVCETVVKIEEIITLTARQFCVVQDPWNEERKTNDLGARKLVRGPANFFLNPGESLEIGVEGAYFLAPWQAVMVRAREDFVDEAGYRRKPGSSWLVYGPQAFVPPTQVTVVGYRQALIAIEQLGLNFFFWVAGSIPRS